MRMGRDSLEADALRGLSQAYDNALGLGILEEWEQGSGKRVGGEQGLIRALRGLKRRTYVARVVLFKKKNPGFRVSDLRWGQTSECPGFEQQLHARKAAPGGGKAGVSLRRALSACPPAPPRPCDLDPATFCLWTCRERI